MGNYKGLIRAGFFFLLLLVVSIMMIPREEAQIVTTATAVPTLTFIPTETIIVLPTMTLTPPPPVNIGVQEPQVVIPEGGSFDNAFYTATVCENVPVLSQPAMNYNLIIGKLYKGNRIDVTGQSQFWARISYFSSGQVGYVPLEYVQC